MIDERNFEDFDTRIAIRENLDETFVVEAAAGTGKTSELVARLLNVIGQGRGRIEGMVAVTFTEKAAGELKLRLRERLEQARLNEGEGARAERFEAAIRSLELAPIGTIHGFCADLLREFPVEAGVDPLFEVADEAGAEALQNEAFQNWFEAVLSDPPRSVQRVLRGSSREGPREALWNAAKAVIDRRDFTAEWELPKGDYLDGMRDLVERMVALGAYAVHGPDANPLVRALTDFYETARNIKAYEFGGESSSGPNTAQQDWVEGVLRAFASGSHWTHTGWDESLGDRTRNDLVAERDALQKDFNIWLKRADAHLAATLRADLEQVLAHYEALKRRDGILDFFDLLLRSRDLLASDPHVLSVLRNRFTHVFIDEFQDTDPRQTDVLWALASEDGDRLTPGKLFVVGDPKQAIYRFRRADIGVYDRAKERILAAGGRLVRLSTSFRARPELQRVINRAFEPVFGEGKPGVQAAHVRLGPARDERPEQPACVVLPIADPWNDWGSKFWPGRGEPASVAAFIAWLVSKSGWTVEDEGERRAIRAEDICLLMTRMQTSWSDIAATYTEELERRGIDHVLVAGRAFHEREEIVAMRAALGAIEWPGDRLRVYAALRGPLFALDDNLLLLWKQHAGHFDPLVEPSDVPEELRTVAEALRVLAELHVLRNHRSAAETCTALLGAVRAHAAFALWPSGAHVLANIARLVELARRHDQSEALSFRAFVETLDDADESGRRDSILLEAGSGGVRVMTVHAAKGLEFPVVVLCDMSARMSFDEPNHYVDLESGLWAGTLAGAVSKPLLEHRKIAREQERAEGQRKLYVAATRARDLLVVPGIGDYVPGHFDVSYWTRPLLDVITPGIDERRDVQTAPGCPAFKGTDTVLVRRGKPNSQAQKQAGTSVRPGLQGNGVVWWDPSILELEARRREGLRGAKLLSAKGKHAQSGRDEYGSFLAEGASVRKRAQAPSIRARTATAASQLEAAAGRPVTVVTTGASSAARPRGPRFGTLVHAIIGEAAFDAGESELASLAAFHARALGASEEEREAAAVAARSALDHPVLKRAAKSSDARREVMLVHKQVDGAVLEGVADLVFYEQDPFGESKWVVVDFKTDLEDDVKPAYQVQIELYAAAVEAATGQPCEGVLLGV